MRCLYCGMLVDVHDIPDIDDEEGWTSLEGEHGYGCGWIRTRAWMIVEVED